MNDPGPNSNYWRKYYLHQLIFIILFGITVFIASLFKGCSNADGLKDYSQPLIKDHSLPLKSAL